MSKALELVEIAREHLGCAEEGCDNGGAVIAEYFRKPFKPGKNYGNWCAAVVSYWLETIMAGVPRSNGAKRVCRNVGKAGHWVARPVLFSDPAWTYMYISPEPGDVISWHRGPGKDPSSWWRDWRGHVEIVESYDLASDTLVTIGGNRGRFPAVVSRTTHHLGSWRRKLYGIARLS